MNFESIFLKYKSCNGYTKGDYDKTCKDAQYVVQHKYDGSNFQIMFIKFDNCIKIKFASRNRILEKDFNNHFCITKDKEHVDFFENIRNFLKSSKYTTINLYGEIYGHVQKRIKYIDLLEMNKIKYFDVVFDGGKYECAKFFMKWANEMKIPTVETFFQGTLEECINFDISIPKSPFGDAIEGVVIKPYDFKKKQIGFEEIGVIKNKMKRKDGILFELNEFYKYLNENRAYCTLSKEPYTNISSAVEDYLKDAFEAFKDDYNDIELSFDLVSKVFTKQAHVTIVGIAQHFN